MFLGKIPVNEKNRNSKFKDETPQETFERIKIEWIDIMSIVKKQTIN